MMITLMTELPIATPTAGVVLSHLSTIRDVFATQNQMRRKKGEPPTKKREQARDQESPPALQQKSKGGRISKGAVQWLVVKIPVGYLRIIDAEAARIGLDRRSFVMFLHRRRTGEVPSKGRPLGIPKYELTLDEMQTPVIYKWPVTLEQRTSVERQRSLLGGPSNGWYVIQSLCDWLGVNPDAMASAIVKSMQQPPEEADNDAH